MIKLNLVERSVLVVDRYTLHRVQRRIGAVNYLAEDGVFAVQMSLLGICNEELSAQDLIHCMMYVLDTETHDLFESGPELAIATTPRALN